MTSVRGCVVGRMARLICKQDIVSQLWARCPGSNVLQVATSRTDQQVLLCFIAIIVRYRATQNGKTNALFSR